MATDEERLLLRIEAQLTQFDRELKKALGTSQKTRRSIEKEFTLLEKRLAGFGRSISTAFGAGLLTGGLAQLPQLVAQVVSEAAGLQDVSDKVGISVENLQRLQFAAEQSGISIETLSGAAQKFAINISEAGRGQGELYEILKANNVAIRDQSGNLRPQMELWGEVANLVHNAGSEQDQLNISYRAFGKSGADVVLMLRDGKAALEDMMRVADEFGAVLDKDIIRRAAEIDDKFAALSRGIGTQFKEGILEAVSAVQELKDLWSSDTSWIDKMKNTFSILDRGRPITPRPPVSNAARKADREVATQRATIIPTAQDARDEAAAARRQQEQEEERREFQLQQVLNGAGAVGRATKDVEEANRALADSYRELGAIGVDAFADIVIQGENAIDVLNDLVKMLAKAALQAMFLGTGPLGGLFGTSESGGILGALIPKRAGGGGVNRGQAYEVGESGAELFVPTSSGMIIPNKRLRGGGTSVVIHADFRGAEAAAVGALSVKLAQMERDLPNRIRGVEASERRRVRGAR